jgi:hypothetical protein
MGYKTATASLSGMTVLFIEEITMMDNDRAMENSITLKIQVLAEDFGKKAFCRGKGSM